MPWRQIRPPEVSTNSDSGLLTTVVAYRVWDVSPAAILSLSSGAPIPIGDGQIPETFLPLPGSNLPEDPRLTLRQYVSRSESENVWELTAEYASGEIVIFPGPDLAYAWAGEFQTETVTLPYLVRRELQLPAAPASNALPNDPPPPPRIVAAWETDRRQILETRVRHSRRVRITGNLSNAIEIIEGQNNLLQQIGTRWYRFEAGDYVQISNSTFTVQYSFIRDAGTRRIGPSDISLTEYPQQIFTDIDMFGANPPPPPSNRHWARPPFHEIITVPGPFEPGQQEPPRPNFATIRPYELSETIGMVPGQGWTNLPQIGPP